ncbi:hypothetical protein [Paenibacillus polymyxa]|uniref:hypothetical protein n=1 Tax=Paenibacillus polymyxa TaxID=1406 RepID=UPI0020244581|nr:hypothetical protein [Paenibacillus polymyxa]MDU8675348.1 hypothetical protein [Paenibacillus polymyxa]MDU8700255.1 hypothetical protein [Paenibacillus polymyxa]URJ54872.1 hypothetical protein MF623_004271 [Paenibacillus polymyxa]URJ66715.1 hypothetical protein MF620_001617 [Paenibacillus polymyxa]URJ69385.1 hypothetical protein MF624_004252 [Paenibacillus polymyxa]
MFKSKKALPAVLMSFVVFLACFSGILGEQAKASEAPTQHIQLNTLYVDLPYSSDKYDIQRSESAKEVEINVTEKESGNVVYTVGELKESKTIKPQDITTNGYETRTVYQDYKDGFVTARLYSVMSVYSSGSFGEISNVLETYWAPVSDGSWSLENTHANTISTTGKFPTQRVQITGTAVVDTVETQSGGVSLAVLGYNLGVNNHMRKAISQGFTFSYGR